MVGRGEARDNKQRVEAGEVVTCMLEIWALRAMILVRIHKEKG